ncbi:uncharacterized protein LOC129915176 [Episyrphus balteatus]|uniref:uncharacterized protein LOC129915176 n=1 Tax=Episyrphus balteatus TaxID=286459 RepID=UPI0024861230|nr:uncharacterized protein LOC129915176 [Episyrphus balteatus]
MELLLILSKLNNDDDKPLITDDIHLQSTSGTGQLNQGVIKPTRDLAQEPVSNEFDRSNLVSSLGMGGFHAPQERSIERVGRWNVQFTGERCGTSVNSFLERVEELRVARGVSEALLFRSVVDLLTGQALLWYRSIREEISNWSEFVDALKYEFLPANYDDLLLEQINRRTQGKGESYGAYLATMRTLFKRLGEPLSERRKVAILLKNLDPFYQKQIGFHKPQSVKELAALGRDLETLRANIDSFEPPARNRNCVEPELGYTAGPAVQPKVAAVARDEQPVRVVESARSQPNRSSQADGSVRCFNCGKVGHFSTRCSTPRKCFGCGAEGVTRSNCKRCSGNAQRARAPAGREFRRN